MREQQSWHMSLGGTELLASERDTNSRSRLTTIADHGWKASSLRSNLGSFLSR